MGLELRDDMNNASKDRVELLVLNLFHRLWTEDRYRKTYDKDKWCALQLGLNKLGVKV